MGYGVQGLYTSNSSRFLASHFGIPSWMIALDDTRQHSLTRCHTFHRKCSSRATSAAHRSPGSPCTAPSTCAVPPSPLLGDPWRRSGLSLEVGLFQAQASFGVYLATWTGGYGFLGWFNRKDIAGTPPISASVELV